MFLNISFFGLSHPREPKWPLPSGFGPCRWVASGVARGGAELLGACQTDGATIRFAVWAGVKIQTAKTSAKQFVKFSKTHTDQVIATPPNGKNGMGGAMNEPTEMVECGACGFVPKHQRRKLRAGIETFPLDPEAICDECLSVWRRLFPHPPRHQWKGDGSPPGSRPT